MSTSKIRWTVLALALPTTATFGGCDAHSDFGGALPVVWVPADETSAVRDGQDGGLETSIPFTNNPVFPGYHADPQVALFGKTFYIYPTTDGYVNWTSTSFSVFSSTNLVNWSNRGVILDLPRDLTWAQDRAWAPGIAFKGGIYYLYFAAAQEIGVATSTSPTGPFKDALGHPLISSRIVRRADHRPLRVHR